MHTYTQHTHLTQQTHGNNLTQEPGCEKDPLKPRQLVAFNHEICCEIKGDPSSNRGSRRDPLCMWVYMHVCWREEENSPMWEQNVRQPREPATEPSEITMGSGV